VLAACAAAVLAGRLAVLGSIARPLGPLGGDLLEHGVPRVWTVLGIWTHYVRLMVFPLDLSSDYSPDVIPIALGWSPLAALGLLLGLSVLLMTWASWRERALAPASTSARVVGLGVLWFMVTVAPIANVFFLAGVLLAERTLYLPSVGAVAAAGWLLYRVWERNRQAAVGLTVIVVGLMGFRTWLRTPTWKDNATVFATMVRDYPQSGRSQWVLGDLFFGQGRRSQALRSYRLAIGILGGHPQLLIEISKRLMAAGEHQTARALLLHAWKDEPRWAVAPGYLAVSHFQGGEWAEAERYARASLEADPEQRVMSHVLAGALAEQGRYREAIPWREHTIAHGEGEDWEQWITLARLRLTVGDSVGARIARDSAIARAGGPDEARQIGSRYTPYGAL
jgi:cytochrome c-type biogenesis protein CcmH/NrfG